MTRWTRNLCLWILVVVVTGPMSMARGDGILAVSMVQLVTRPGQYIDKRIEVFGYLGIDGKLYLTRDHATARDGRSSVAVSDTDTGAIASSTCPESYVRVRGQLVELDNGYPIIADLESVYQPDRGKECWARKE